MHYIILFLLIKSQSTTSFLYINHTYQTYFAEDYVPLLNVNTNDYNQLHNTIFVHKKPIYHFFFVYKQHLSNLYLADDHVPLLYVNTNYYNVLHNTIFAGFRRTNGHDGSFRNTCKLFIFVSYYDLTHVDFPD